MEQIRRIAYMETLLNELLAGLAGGNLHGLAPKVRELTEYYDGPLWRADYEADELGLLPAELNRGVLSEDGIYNALCEFEWRNTL